jgi:TonB family protein
MKIWISAALAATALAAAGGAALAGDDKAQPSFIQHAKPADIAAAYPKAAFEKKITGDVLLDCTANDAGSLVDCRIVEEEPAGLGFGEAALSLVSRERVKTKDRAGASVVGRRFEKTFSFLAPGDANPDWMKKPGPADMAGVFPKAAAKKGVDGKAVIRCQSSVEGFLQKCVVLSETPADLNFGAAALQLAPQFRMTPKIRGGKPVVTKEITIPIIWRGFADYRPSPVGDSLVLDPPWSSAPTAAQVRAAWPANAKGATSGQVALRCAFDKTGGLSDCTTISEIPSNRGFAKAARSLTSQFKVRFEPDQAKTLGKYSVDVPFRFRDPAAPDGRKITTPKWTRTMTAEAMAATYPQAAVKAGVMTGAGTVACVVDAQGVLTDCQVRREDPAGLDFGAAAIEAAKLMAMNPWSKEGEPVDGLPIVLPIRFNWQDDAPAAAPAPAPTKP